MGKIILYGGSFDPIHNGHLRIAKGASLLLNAKIIFIPSKSPRWKNPEATISNRLDMLKIALKESNLTNYEISTYEIKSKSEINYSINTIKYFKKKYPNEELYFLIGGDQVNKFSQWKNAEEIVSLCKVTYVERDDIDINQEIVKHYGLLPIKVLNIGDVSSTKIKSLSSLDISKGVREYIEENELYYCQKLRSCVDLRRYKHCVSVGRLSYKIAISNNLDNPDDAYIAGLLHDLGKGYDKNLSNRIMNEHFFEYKNMPGFAVHQFVGSYLAKHFFDISNQDIIDAIEYHASGKANMCTLGKIIYSADKIDPLRGYDSSDMINACLKDYNSGFKYVLRENKKVLLKKERDIGNRLTMECMKQYLEEE